MQMRTTRKTKGNTMRDRLKHTQGIRAYRRATIALAGSTLVLGGGAAQAQDLAEAPAELGGQGGDDVADGPSIVVTSERERINTLNSRLGKVQDAPQSISIVSREVMEQQAASSLRDVLRNVSGISMAAGEGGGGPGGD